MSAELTNKRLKQAEDRLAFLEKTMNALASNVLKIQELIDSQNTCSDDEGCGDCVHQYENCCHWDFKEQKCMLED